MSLRLTLAAAASLPMAAAQNSLCFGRSDMEGASCDDGNPKTLSDHCYEGFCGGWLPVPSTVWSEAEREDWIEHDGDAPCIAGEVVSRCGGHGAVGGGEAEDQAGLCSGSSGHLPLCGGCAASGVSNRNCVHTGTCVGAHDAAATDGSVVYDPPARQYPWIDTKHTGHFGTGFADYSGTEGGESITWTLRACTAGYYHLNFGYALRSGNRPMRVLVNDNVVGGCGTLGRAVAVDGGDDSAKCQIGQAMGKAHLLSFPATGGWSNWGQVGTKAYLAPDGNGRVTIKLESAGFTGPNIDGLEVLPACTAAAHIDGQPSGCGDTPPADLGDYEGCRNCDCHECADPNNPASFPMYLAVTADHAHGQTATDRGVESYIRWRQATDKHSMWVGRLDPDYRFGKFRPGQLGNYHNELVPTGAIGGDCSNGATDSAAIVANCGWDADAGGDPDANPYRGRVLFKGAGDNRAFMNGIIRSENGHGRITGYQTIDLFLEETDIKITSVNAKSKVGKYQVAPMHVGQKYYIDRDYTVAGLPDFLTGVQVIQTANDDKHESADDFLCFKISSPATIYVLYDSRATPNADGTIGPAWLNTGFTNTHVAAVESTDSNMGTFLIFYENKPNGRVCLGGNDAPGVESNYIVLVGPPVDMTCHPSGKVDISDVTSHTAADTDANPELAYRVAELHTKQPYYVDRSYVLTSVPSFFVGLQSIMTGNNDKHSAEEPTVDPETGEFTDGFICFTVAEDARVYILYDTRATTRPAWLNTYFVDKHEESGVNHTDTNMANGFEVYSGVFELNGRENKKICLGGNDPVEDRGGASSMYLVFVGPPDVLCDGVAAVSKSKTAAVAKGPPTKLVFFVLLLLLAVGGACHFGKKYRTLHNKVKTGSIYSDEQFKGYVGASDANPASADTAL